MYTSLCMPPDPDFTGYCELLKKTNSKKTVQRRETEKCLPPSRRNTQICQHNWGHWDTISMCRKVMYYCYVMYRYIRCWAVCNAQIFATGLAKSYQPYMPYLGGLAWKCGLMYYNKSGIFSSLLVIVLEGCGQRFDSCMCMRFMPTKWVL